MDKKEERYRYPYIFGDIMLSDKEFFGDEEEYLFLGYFEDGKAVLTVEGKVCCPKSCVTIVYPTLDEVYANEKMLDEVRRWSDDEIINYHDVAMVYCEIKKEKEEVKDGNKD